MVPWHRHDPCLGLRDIRDAQAMACDRLEEAAQLTRRECREVVADVRCHGSRIDFRAMSRAGDGVDRENIDRNLTQVRVLRLEELPRDPNTSPRRSPQNQPWFRRPNARYATLVLPEAMT